MSKTMTAILCAAIGLSACTTMGTGSGSVSPGGEAVKFSWKSTDGGISGTMSAALKDGQTFSGAYLQVTSTTRWAAAGRASASSKAAARWMPSLRPQRRTSTATLNT